MNIDTTIEIRQLQKIHAMAGIGYWVYNHNTNEMWWSDVTYELLGYSDKNINPNKENLTKHIHPEDLGFFHDALKIAKNQIDFEFRFYRNGELRLGKINGEILNDNGIVREEVLFQDITEIKIKEFEIAKAWNKALEAENLKNAFLANMSHELRTPLNSIIGFSELLESGQIDENIPKFANSIKSSGLQLLKIIEDLLKVSMLESRTSKPIKRDFNINKMLLELKESTLIQMKNCEKNDIELKFNFGLKDDDSLISSDQFKIRGILQNILNNAIKFTTKGNINCSYSIKNKTLHFTITDTGSGIPQKHIDKAFMRFRKAHDITHTDYGGTGLGLYISRLEVELLGGKIWIVSEENIGTTVHFSIPNVVDSTPESVNTTKTQYNWENYTVLIAEDQFSNYKILEAYLQSTNINIVWAQTGREAIKVCSNKPEINIVLMDINMPHICGLEATKVIKNERPNLTVIAQTAYALEGDEEKSLAAGCVSHLAKPFNKIDLLTAMAKHLP